MGWKETGKGAIVRGKNEIWMLPLNADKWVIFFPCVMKKKNVILNSRDWRVNRDIGTERTSLGGHGVWAPLNS